MLQEIGEMILFRSPYFNAVNTAECSQFSHTGTNFLQRCWERDPNEKENTIEFR